jgi:hypothetical protein
MMVRDAYKMTRFLLIAVILAITGGCAEEDPEPAEPASERAQSSRGIITAALNRYIETGDFTPAENFGLMGVFARYQARHHTTVEKLLEGDGSVQDLALDSCTMPAPVLDEMEIDEPGAQAPIELMDVGDLRVTIDDLTKPVPTRTFPDLLRVIVGVIYSAEEAHGVFFKPGDRYLIRASGTDEVAPFRVALDAPDDLGEIKIDGIFPSDQKPIITRGEEVEISWEGDGYGDEVVLTLSWMSMGSSWSMDCRMRDDGLFVIPESHTASFPDPLTCSDEEISISRIRQVAFRSDGLQSGTFRFLVSINFPVTF